MITHSINSKIDDLPISVMISKPKGSPKGIVQLVHGMCEYKERYIPFIKYLSLNGYICVIHDHRGHGESVLSDSDLGYFYDAGYTGLIEDTYQVSMMIKEMYPHLSLSLFGHSMGSLVARSYAKKYDSELDHLIVCGSPSYHIMSKIGIVLTRIIGKYVDTHYRSKVILNIAFSKYNSQFKNTQSPNSWICSDPEVVRLYDADSKCNFRFTANGFEHLFRLLNDAYSERDWTVSKPYLPIYFIAGAGDPCIISSSKFKKAVQKMNRVGYTNISQKLYPEMRHEILNEINKEEVWKDILSFLK